MARPGLLPAAGGVVVAAGLTLLSSAIAMSAAGRTAVGVRAQDESPSRREFSVAARKYAFEPARLEVDRNDIVKVTLRALDIPHSFTIDAYRIAKRANPGQTVVFEFHANQAGSFPIYCNLSIDARCKEMHGDLVVREK